MENDRVIKSDIRKIPKTLVWLLTNRHNDVRLLTVKEIPMQSCSACEHYQKLHIDTHCKKHSGKLKAKSNLIKSLCDGDVNHPLRSVITLSMLSNKESIIL